MVIQYPYVAKLYVAGESVKDSNGNWSPESRELIFETRCRPEPNKGNQFVIGVDGKQIIFSSIVYMPLPVAVLSGIEVPGAGSAVRIYAGEKIIYIVPADFALGQTTVVVPGISGNTFYLTVDGRPLKLTDEYTVNANGFTLQGAAGTLIPGQRYELQKYYSIEINSSGGITVSSDFRIKPGTFFEIWEGENRIINDTVKQFSKGQLNMRAWL